MLVKALPLIIIELMRLSEFDGIVSEILKISDFTAVDNAVNGLQVGNTDQDIKKIAFAVDASMASFQRAAEAGADLLFVHHGLFWGNPVPIKGSLYSRIKFLVDHDLSLYAAHLPLDSHPSMGNNAGLARYLELIEIEPFGEYRGIRIGFKGKLRQGKTIGEISKLVCGSQKSCLSTLPFGSREIRSIGIVSGRLPSAVHEAIREKLDLFITGESSHEIYHDTLEAGINVIFGGHYRTEIWGVKALAEHFNNEDGFETTLVDIPTGL